MPNLLASVQPSREGVDLASFMLARDDVQREILTETIQSAQRGRIMESGRTFCGHNAGSIRGPLARFPRAVDLQECPTGLAGIMHSHVSAPQLRQPEHSLPDLANVVMADVGASVVIGTATSDVVVGPADRQAGLAAFQDALGLDVTSSMDVIQAIHSGDISDPHNARQRVRSSLSPLIWTADTAHPDLDRQVSDLHTDGSIPARSPLNVACHSHIQPGLLAGDQRHRDISECCRDMRQGFKSGEGLVRGQAIKVAQVDVTTVAVSAAIGSVVSAAISRYTRL